MSDESRMSESFQKLTLERPFVGPPERVFDAMLDPRRIGRWLFRTPGGALETAELEPKSGGTFTIVERRGQMAAPHFGTLRKIERPKRLVFDFAVAREQTPTEVAIALKPSGDRTLVTLTHTVEARWAEYAPMILAGWSRMLASLSSLINIEGERRLSTSVLIDAPPGKVWRQWTEGERLALWWGGTQAPRPRVDKLDVAVGGGFVLRSPAPDGQPVTLEGVFREVEPRARLAYDARCETAGTVLYEEVIEVGFAPSGKGRTVLTVSAPLAPATLRQSEAGLDDLRITWARVWADSLDALAQRACEP